MNRLRIPVADKPRKLKSALGFGSGPEGRIDKIRMLITALFRHERVEGTYNQMDESRGYAELLIQQAIMHGPKHEETMQIADYYLMEKDLVQKLFKVLVPRYQQYNESYTAQHVLPVKYPENKMMACLELKGNPYPTIAPQLDSSKWLNNVLIASARRQLGGRAVNEAQVLDENTEKLVEVLGTSDEPKDTPV